MPVFVHLVLISAYKQIMVPAHLFTGEEKVPIFVPCCLYASDDRESTIYFQHAFEKLVKFHMDYFLLFLQKASKAIYTSFESFLCVAILFIREKPISSFFKVLGNGNVIR